MSPLLLRLCFMIIGVASFAVSDENCEVLSCDGLEPGDMIPDPYNCKRYYVCLTNCHVSDAPFECSGDQLFNSTSGKCESSDVECSFCQPKCTRFSCNIEEDDPYLAADPTDCTRYLVCGLNPDPIYVECPEGEYFDGTGCQDDPNQCCDSCVVFCEVPFTEIADPKNCSNFYYCPMAGYYPEEESVKSCPHGQTFSAEEGFCSDSATCHLPICQGLVNNARNRKPLVATCGDSSESLF